jgi:thiamine biosynthesis protein ThiI
VSEEHVVLVGYAEVGTKSSEVRTKMAGRLAANARAALSAAGVGADVDRRWSRLVVETDRPDEAAATLATLPGVAWARPCVVERAELDAVVTALRRLAETRHHGSDESFAVESRRVGPSSAHDFSSRDVDVEGGRVVQRATGASVDLDDPERTYYVEVRGDEAFLAAVEYEGPRGLPLGTQGRAVALVSGGIDSPVAAWQVMRRGCVTVPLYVDLGDYGGPDHRARAVEVVRTLARRAPREDLRPRVVEGGDLVELLVEEVEDTRMLSLRRAMLAMAEEVADRCDAHSVVTGESLGQKSSQTGANLAVTDAAVSLPVHRPLLTWDKTDVVAAARGLGTYDDSTLPVGCERVAPAHPETNATLADVVAAEPDGLLELAREAAREASVRTLDA